MHNGFTASISASSNDPLESTILVLHRRETLLEVWILSMEKLISQFQVSHNPIQTLKEIYPVAPHPSSGVIVPNPGVYLIKILDMGSFSFRSDGEDV